MGKKTAKWETRECPGCGKSLTRQLSQCKSLIWYCGATCKAHHNPSPMIVAGAGKETRACPNCGKPVTKYLSQIKSGAGWACSRTCGATIWAKRRIAEGRWQPPKKPRTGTNVLCEVCAKEFYRGPRSLQRYCSNACQAVSQSKPPILRNCGECGAEMRLKPSQDSKLFCSRNCYENGRNSRQVGRSFNGRPVLKTTAGYLTVYVPDHPCKWKASSRVFEHRIVMEKTLGRYLTPDKQVDHINEIKDDNRPENLQVLSASDHSKKTNGDQKAKTLTLLEELQEYRRRFGSLDNQEE